jgi:hypothetical protein
VEKQERLEERGEETEVVDDPARDRAARVIGLPDTRRNVEECNELTDRAWARAWARRRWEVVRLRATAARNSGPS